MDVVKIKRVLLNADPPTLSASGFGFQATPRQDGAASKMGRPEVHKSEGQDGQARSPSIKTGTKRAGPKSKESRTERAGPKSKKKLDRTGRQTQIINAWCRVKTAGRKAKGQRRKASA